MAVIQRPVKTYGTRTYAAEVAAAPGNLDTILATEVDGDLDTMYGAWNGGADTVNIKDGAVTSPKLGSNLSLVGTLTLPTTPNVLQWGAGASNKGHLVATTSPGNVYLTNNATLNAGETAWLQDNAANPSWLLSLAAAGGGDAFQLYRMPAGGALTNLLSVAGPTGDLTILGRAIYKYYTGGIYGANTVANGQTRQFAILNTAWWTSSLNNPAANRIDFDRPGIVLLYAKYDFAPAATGFGVGIAIEQYNGSAYGIVNKNATRTEGTISVLAMLPAWDANYQWISVSLSNATGASVSGTAYLSGQYLGAF
jgi:hypothetical protein